MKKLCTALLIFVLITSVSATYTQSAEDVSPAVFPEGEYFFPSAVYLGTDTDPGLTSMQTASLYVTDADNVFGITAVSDSSSGAGVYASGSHAGIYGYSDDGKGVYGVSASSSSSSAGVYGYANSGSPAVYGYDSSGSGIGVKAYSTHYGFYSSGAMYGIYIPSSLLIGGLFYGDVTGVKAYGATYGGRFEGDLYGVYGYSDSYGGYFEGDNTGVYGKSTSSTSKECGVKGYNSASGNTAYLGCYNKGIYTPDDASILGALDVGSCSGCDVAEHFLGDNLEAGDVVVLDSTALQGVRKTTTPYDKLAAGIVSTEPTITMGLKEGVPIALSGVVPTKVIGKVNVGDLLTTSSTAGYAMACDDYNKCAGAIIGKAMENNAAGKGKIMALVMLG